MPKPKATLALIAEAGRRGKTETTRETIDVSDDTIWTITRGPRIGEDLVAWCEEQATEAVEAYILEEGRFRLSDKPEAYRDKRILPWTVRFVVPEYSHLTREVTLSDLIDQEVADYLPDEPKPDQPLLFSDEDHPKWASLRDLLRAKADEIDRYLGNST